MILKALKKYSKNQIENISCIDEVMNKERYYKFKLFPR